MVPISPGMSQQILNFGSSADRLWLQLTFLYMSAKCAFTVHSFGQEQNLSHCKIHIKINLLQK